MSKITNNAAGVRVVNAKVNGKIVQMPLKSGETKELDVVETAAFKARIESRDFTVGKSAEKAASKDETGLKAEHHGGGKFNVTHGETLLLSGLSKADADAFNAMSETDKAAYVEASKP